MNDRDPAKPQLPADNPRRPSLNYGAWLGPLVTFVGAISYFVYFVRFADLRDFPWVNLPLVGLGAMLSIVDSDVPFECPDMGCRPRSSRSSPVCYPLAWPGCSVSTSSTCRTECRPRTAW